MGLFQIKKIWRYKKENVINKTKYSCNWLLRYWTKREVSILCIHKLLFLFYLNITTNDNFKLKIFKYETKNTKIVKREYDFKYPEWCIFINE